MIRVLDLFSCIGFHSLGLERASPEFEIVALCEANERRRQELARLHPGVLIHDDVRTLPVIEADVVFGGPPCQRTSVAAAIHGKRDGHSLWPYMLCAGIDAGAEWIVVEQPPGNAAWEAQVNRQLSRAGYHIARFVFGAEDVGAPYPRRRVYLIACTSLPRLEIAWQAGPSAIERAKGAADARGDWNPDAIPTFDLDTWRTEDVHERREAIEALGDSNPPAMAEVIGYMISDAMAGGAGFEPALPEGRPNYQSGAINHSATPAASAEMVPAFRNCNPLRQTHLWEALKPFVEAFEKRRDAYSKRYQDRELGFSNFDKMPDDWAMEAIPFDMGTYRRARAALASEGSTDA